MLGINRTSGAQVLHNLRQINENLSTSQLRIGTGRKINSAADGAVIWAVAAGLQTENAAIDSINSAITVAKGSANVSVAALDTVIDLLYEVKDLALEAYSDTTGSFTAYAARLVALDDQIFATLDSSVFNGENWLTDTSAAQTIRTGVSDATQTIALTTTDLYDATTGAIAVFNDIPAITDAASALTLSNGADAAIAALTDYSVELSTFSTALGYQQDFLTALGAIRDDAISGLVDADLTEESAKVVALQTQQSLAYQALSIGNRSSQNILRLFQ